MKKSPFLFPVVVLLSVVSLASAQPPGFGKGKGHGPGHGPGGGGEFRGVIHELFAAHADINRKVEMTEKGYRAVTTSQKPEVAKKLQTHVAQMEARLDGGMSVRHWDPAFAELREHYDDLEVTVNQVKGGVSVEVIGKTPEAVKVARNHAKIVSGFVKKGSSEMHKEHSRALK